MTVSAPPYRSHALALIVLFLVTSALIRVVLVAAPAIAREGEGAVEAQPDKSENHAKLLALFEHREADLIRREVLVKKQEKAVAMATEALQVQMADLQTAEAALRDTLALAHTVAEEDLSGLTKMYETMKPKDAAALFEAMEPGFAAGFLGRMKTEAAAEILAGISPDVAYAISAILAGRNARVPKD